MELSTFDDENSYLSLFDELPEEREQNIFACELWVSSTYSQFHQSVTRDNSVAIDDHSDDHSDDDNDDNKPIFNDPDHVKIEEEQQLKQECIVCHDNDIIDKNIQSPGSRPIEALYELKLIYQKMLASTIIVLTFCILALIIAIIRNFYTWPAILFNVIIILLCILGLKCGIYNDYHSLQHVITKLKLLLIYWSILCNLLFLLFTLLIIYAIIMSIRYHNHSEYSTLTIITSILSYLFGVFFWCIFVLFYIDLVSRACLKRGRIDYIIMRIISNNIIVVNADNQGLNEKNIWYKIYKLNINYRFLWRQIRKWFTSLTGIRCLFDKEKLFQDKHEEKQRVIKMLRKGTDINRENMKCNACVYCLFYPFKCCYQIILKTGILCMKCCGGCCVNLYECGQSITFGTCCIYICGVICGLFIIWIGLPFLLWIFVSCLIIIACFGIIRICPCIDANWFLYIAVGCGCLIGVEIFFVIWFILICPEKPFVVSSENQNRSWDQQCNVWSYVLYFIVEFVGDMTGGTDNNYI